MTMPEPNIERVAELRSNIMFPLGAKTAIQAKKAMAENSSIAMPREPFAGHKAKD